MGRSGVYQPSAGWAGTRHYDICLENFMKWIGTEGEGDHMQLVEELICKVKIVLV
jgi:hypothetical protein